jgi:hypothetical protein
MWSSRDVFHLWRTGDAAEAKQTVTTYAIASKLRIDTSGVSLRLCYSSCDWTG